MASEAQSTEHELLKTGLAVGFRIVSEEVLTALDEAEFGMRLELKFVAEDDDDEQDEADVAEETAEWGSLGFLFVLGALSFADAKPRNLSVVDYSEKDDFGLGLHGSLGFLFVLGALSFADAKPRNLSVVDYSEKDDFGLADFMRGLQFLRGELHFDADYIRGRRIKTRVAIRTDGTVRLETIGRGKAASFAVARADEGKTVASSGRDMILSPSP